jgi:AraC-like DNA-binding protein
LECYEEWNVTIPSIPPRSRLYRLEPIGIGTPYVESLTSYIMRLAGEHCVTPQALVQREIFPLWNQSGAIQNSNSWLGKFWWESTPVLNGMSSITTQWVSVLQTLTSCDNLRFLTMLTWSEVIGINKLLRRKKAWCPQCFQEWRQNRQVIYEPLLWTLNSVDICSYHQLPLATLCQHCQEAQPFLKQVARPGYCSHCMCWLGKDLITSNAETMSNDTELRNMCRWKASVVGELLAAAPMLLKPPSKEQTADVLNYYLKHYARGGINVLARLLKLTARELHKYLQKEDLISFDSLMQLCHIMLIKPLDFLTKNPMSSRDIPDFVLDHLPVLSLGSQKSVTDKDVQLMRRALKLVLEIDKENPFPFPSLRRVAQRIGCYPATLQKHCPDLCHAIVTRYRQLWTGEDACMRMKQALENALVGDKLMPLKAVARQLGCASAVLYEHYPDLSQSVVTRYRGERLDKVQIRQQLQDMLSSSEKMPSIREIARQRGYVLSSLEKNFPDLLAEIALRHRMEQRKQHEERMARICTEIHQTVIELHQQGVYPSSVRVAKQLNNSHILWLKEARKAWILALDELGYPTDQLKKYT